MIQADRVRENTSSQINSRLDAEIEKRLLCYADASNEQLTRRIDELNQEWDIERYLETMASSLALSGVVLGATQNKKWFILPGVVLPFLLQHAVQGWCPPLPLLRRLGVRTRKEIELERYALKALRGDFKERSVEAGIDESDTVKKALGMVSR